MSQIAISHPRFLAHSQALACMRRDDFLQALQILKKTHENYSHHILLLIDLASCYYMLNDFHNYQKWTLLALQEFQTVRPILNSKSIQHAVLGLGKILEELGWVSEAYNLYQSHINIRIQIEDRVEQENSFFRIEAQALRLQAELRMFSDIHVAYNRCERYQIFDSDVEYEMQSALMLCDFHLLGFNSAYKRLLSIRSNKNYSASEQRLAFFNLLYEVLATQKSVSLIPEDCLQAYSYFDCDHFERCLLDLWSLDHSETPMDVIDTSRSERLSPLSAIRYLRLVSQRAQLEVAGEAHKKVLLLLKSLSQPSRSLILNQWGLQSKEALSELEIGDSDLILNGQFLCTSASHFSLVCLFLESRRVSVERSIEILYALELSESSLNRLRTLVRRCNEKLGPHLGLEKVFSLTKHELCINEHLVLKDIRSQKLRKGVS